MNKLKERTSSSQLSKKLSRISINEVQLQAIIGEGEFGTVYKGTYNGVINYLRNKAIKSSEITKKIDYRDK